MKINFYVGALLFLSGCMVGPNYHKPDVAVPEQFEETKNNSTEFVADQDLLQWWKGLEDPFLDQLMEETFQSNFDLRIALEQVIQARAEFHLEAAKLFPEFNLDGAVTRTRQSDKILNPFSGATIPSAGEVSVSPFQNIFQIGFDAIWEMDVFGKLRRAKRAALFNWESIQENARDVQITVLSEVAKDYVAICASQKKVSLAEETISIDRESLQLIQALFEAGLADESQVQTARASLDLEEASLQLLQTSLKQSIYRLAVLLGKQPEALIQDFEIIRPIPVAIGKIPAGLPSDLLRRRPDIRRAERKLAAATEQIGVAVAELFPQFFLTASNLFAANPSGSNYGFASDKLHSLFSAPSRTWSVGPAFTLPIFDFGKRRANVKVQTAVQKQALITYEKTIMTALEEVESTLVAYFKEEERLGYLTDFNQANLRNLTLADDRFTSGLSSLTEALNARKAWVDSENSVTESRQALTSKLIAVYKALGGEWCSSSP